MSTVRDELVEIIESFQDAWGDINSMTNREILAQEIEAKMVRGDISCIDCFRYEDGVLCKYSCATIKGFILEGE